MSFGTVPGGMYCAWILIVTGPDELMVVSGKLKGLAFMVTPLILVTVSEPGALAGKAIAKGTEREIGLLTTPT